MKPESPLHYHEPENVTRTLEKMYKILRGNISYGNLTPVDTARNVDGYPATAITPGVANTEFSVAHGLNRVPVGFHVVTKNGACDVYQSTTAWTNKLIYLKATVININIKLFIF